MTAPVTPLPNTQPVVREDRDEPRPAAAPLVSLNPIQSFWEWYKAGVKKDWQTGLGMPSAITRGVTGAVIETAQTVAEGGAWLARRIPVNNGIGGASLGETMQPGFDAAYDDAGGARGLMAGTMDPERAAREQYLGKRSDDFVVQLVEDATQFMTSFALLRAGGLGNVAAGAVADATAFEPYEAQLAEMAARTNIPGLSSLGELMSVDADDAALTARLKRSAAGTALGMTLDGLIAGARIIRYQKQLRSHSLTAVEKRQLETDVLREEARIDQISRGEDPASTLMVDVEPDGRATIVESTTGSRGPTFENAAEATAQLTSMTRSVSGVFTPRMGVPEIADRLETALRSAVEGAGKVSDEVMDDLAADALGSLKAEDATAVLTELSKDARIQSVVGEMAAAHTLNMGRRIAALDVILESRPHDAIASEQAIQLVQDLMNFGDNWQWVVGEQGRAMRRRRFQKGSGAVDTEEMVPKTEPVLGQPLGGRKKAPEVDVLKNPTEVKPAGPDVAGMATRDASQAAVDAANIRQVTRLFRLAGGSPKNIAAAVHATNIIKKHGVTEGITEFFVNAILSGPATVQTVVVSGASIGAFEALGRMGAGALTGNRALAREGVDILYNNFAHITDNLRVARIALNEGQSVINPTSAYHAIGGVTGEIVRIPGNVLMAGDEFTRVTNYRSYVRAKSARHGRELGLSGDKLAAKIEADLRAAFDPETGMATIPEALQYAERSTLAGPLGAESFGGKFSTFINETPGLRMLAPFTKTATNLFRFTTMHTPGLSRLNAEARAIMKAGGEEAAVLQTKQAMASMVYMVGLYGAMNDRITGDAPADPGLRELWGKQPYSVQIGGKWISYRRTDPFGMMLGLAADYVQFSNQMDKQDPELEQLAIAMVSAAATGVLTPSMMKGVGDFLDAFADGDPTAIEKWSRQMASSFIPSAVGAMSTDEYLREAQTLSEAMARKVPGWSQTLDPRFDMFGEPVASGGIGNRNSMFRIKDAGAEVEDELYKLGQGFAPFPSRTPSGIDLRDRETFDNGTGVSPYRRMMDLIAKPDSSGQTLRQRVEGVVASERYQNASGGTRDFPGGVRWQLVARERTKAHQRAFATVMREYPLLREEHLRSLRMARMAFRGGEAGLAQAEEMFGELQQVRPRKTSRIRSR